jgi:hypothetical protein
MPQLGLGLRANNSSSSLYDGDAAAYFTRAGVTDATAKAQINAFVKGLKNLGFYNNIVFWPLRSTQNAGTGTTAYSLGGLGTYNGTLTNGPTWGASGITFDGTNDFIGTNDPLNSARIVYVSYLGNLDAALLGAVVGNYNFNGTNETGYEIFHEANTRPTVRFYTTANNGRTSTINCNDGKFHFVTGVTDNTASRISADGTTGAFTNLTNPPRLNSTGNFAIGSGNTIGRLPMKGTISFVAIMDLYTADFDSVRTLYNSTLGANLYDPDAEAYFTTAGITNTTAKQQINDFVVGVKDLGLWNDMVCWPLRSTQNAGSGTTAYSLGGYGTFNGTLVNSPSWGTDGITFTSGSSQTITIPNITTSKTDLILATCQAATSGNLRTMEFSTTGGQFPGIWAGFGNNYYWDVRSTANTLNRQNGGGPVPTSRIFTHGIASTSGASFFVNGTSVLSNAVSSTNGNISDFKINQNGGNGNISFAMFSQSITGNASLYNLYKTTLGQGLSLP